jgi:S-adenosylmethionine-diacylgycerolhomoserine-N-methlytransferase
MYKFLPGFAREVRMNRHCQNGDELPQHRAIEGYYRVHAGIYDLTRWSFLLGRETLVREAAARTTAARILEVGCGTGRNLRQLGRRFPRARLWGVDLSGDMLAVAARKLQGLAPRVTLIQAAYDRPVGEGPGFDLVLFSYCLSMFNPGWEEAIDAAGRDLATGGVIAAVDFHDSGSALFKRWMSLNHVRLDGHLLPGLKSRFSNCEAVVRPAFGGIWSYFLFIGRRAEEWAFSHA